MYRCKKIVLAENLVLSFLIRLYWTIKRPQSKNKAEKASGSICKTFKSSTNFLIYDGIRPNFYEYVGNRMRFIKYM